MKQRISNLLFIIVEKFLKNFWKILLKRSIFSFISIWIIRANGQYVSDIVLQMSEGEMVLAGLTGFTIIYLCWRRFGIYNFKKDYTNKEQQQNERESYLINKFEELGYTDANKDLKSIISLKNLQEELKTSSYWSNHFRPAHLQLENATGSKKSFVNLNDFDYYMLKHQELAVLKSLIKYRENLFYTEFYYCGFFTSAFWLVMKLMEESGDNGGGETVHQIYYKYNPRYRR